MEGEPSSKLYDEALAVRKDVLGEGYVDRALADDAFLNKEFQRYVTEGAWSRWTDERLPRRERSLVTLAVTASLNRMEEFELHVRGAINNGITFDELMAFIEHLGAYAGMPAAISARRAVLRVVTS
jgi:4-carboxymuconolactone decarboxylase